jgi:hypothetical protein
VPVPTYVDRSDLKTWLNIPQDEVRHDAVLDQSLAAAHRWVYDTTGRRQFTLDAAPSARTYRPAGRQVCTDDGYYRFLIDDAGDPTGMVVETGSDATGWTAVTDYVTVTSGPLAHGNPIVALDRPGPWPCYGSTLVRVTARWGWPEVPDSVPEAVLIQAARLSRRPGSPEGVLGGSEWGVVRVGRSDPDAAALLDPLSYGGFG